MVDFVELAQRATDAAEFEAAVLENLNAEVGFDVAFFLTAGATPLLTSMGFDRTATSRLTEHLEAYARELEPVKQAALSAHGVAVDTAVCGNEHVRQTRYFREVAATVRGRHSLLAYVPWRGRTAALVMLGRSGSSFSGQEIEHVEALLPHLGLARAAFGFPAWTPSPLPAAPARGLADRLLGRPHVLGKCRAGSSTIVVRDRAGFREMVATDGNAELVWTRASLADPSQSGWPYADLFHLAPALAKRRARALFVGCGGGVSVQQFAARYPGISLDVVEHEPAVLELAREWFGLNRVPNLTTHVADGAAFIEISPPASWDVIIVDAFDTEARAPSRVVQGSLRAVRRALRPGGAVAWNLIGSLAPTDAIAEFVSAAQALFATVRVVPVLAARERYAPETRRNIVVVAA
jgi:spermidine synthase